MYVRETQGHLLYTPVNIHMYLVDYCQVYNLKKRGSTYSYIVYVN